MSIIGIEKLEFGVDDLNYSVKFMCDFGLIGDVSGCVFIIFSGVWVEFNLIDVVDLLLVFEVGNILCCMIWGVVDWVVLDVLCLKLECQFVFCEIDGVLECCDFNGMMLWVQVSQ